MGYFNRNYKFICKGVDLILEGDSNGLELRSEGFMPSPMKETYSINLTKKLQRHYRDFKKFSEEVGYDDEERSYDPIEAQQFCLDLTLASLYFTIRHPFKRRKLGKIVKKLNDSLAEDSERQKAF